MRRTARIPRTVAILVTLCVAACAETEASRFYTLAPVADTSVAHLPPEEAILIDQVNLPGYLDRPQVVLRSSPYTVDPSEFNRWAETLTDMVPRVIAENLMTLLGTDQIYTNQIGDIGVRFNIDITFNRFDIEPDGSGFVDARWEVLDAVNNVPVTGGRTVVREPASTNNLEGSVVALSRGLTRLSDDIAQGIGASRK